LDCFSFVAATAVSTRLPLFAKGSHAIVVPAIGVEQQHACVGTPTNRASFRCRTPVLALPSWEAQSAKQRLAGTAAAKASAVLSASGLVVDGLLPR